MSRLSERVSGIVASAREVTRSQVISRDREVPGRSPDDLTSGGLAALGGSWISGRSGRVFLVEKRFSSETRHGAVRVGELAERIDSAAEHGSLLASGVSLRPPFMFFDLETTGISGGAGTYAFLVGCGCFEADGSLVTRQFLLARFGDEGPMLELVGRELSRAGALISFNGKSFDGPVLETRYLFHRLDWPAERLAHFDVLHPSRRFWGGWNGLASCTLVHLEQRVLGAYRANDVPGFEIPGRFFSFVRSGDARPLAAVLEHNRVDLLSLAGLTAKLLHLVASGAREARDAGEALALGHIYARARWDERARDALTKALALAPDCGHLRIASLRTLARLERSGGHHAAAASRWAELLDNADCPAHIAHEATEALAVHHEHRLGDLKGAKAWALKNLSAGSRSAKEEATRHRLARIERKISRSASDPLSVSSLPWPPLQPPSAAQRSGHRTSS